MLATFGYAQTRATTPVKRSCTASCHRAAGEVLALAQKLRRRRRWCRRRARVSRSRGDGGGGTGGRCCGPTVARAKATAVGKAGLTAFAGSSPHALARLAGGADAGSGGLRVSGGRGLTVERNQGLAAVIRTREVQSARVVGPLEGRGVAQARLTRAVDDAVAVVSTQVLRATNAFVHRQLTGDLDAAVVQPFLLELRRTTSRKQPEATEGQRTHERVYARPAPPLHPQNVTVAPPLSMFSFSLSPLYHLYAPLMKSKSRWKLSFM